MAYSSPVNATSSSISASYDFAQPSSSHLSPTDSHPAGLLDDGAGVGNFVDDMLDSAVVASDMTRQSSSTFAPSSVFSPNASLIEDFAPPPANGAFYVHDDITRTDGGNMPVLKPSNGQDGNCFMNASNNANDAFSQFHPSQATSAAAAAAAAATATFGGQQMAWPFTPLTPFSPTSGDQFSPADYDSLRSAPFVAAPSTTFDGLPANPTAFTPVQSSMSQPLSGHVQQVAVPVRQGRKDWMSLAAQETETRPLPKRMRPNTPPRAFSPHHHRRRDGIRKKNARFEIPAERSLFNIDQLISQSTNDDEVKELKQQKRLLRNRQAALDSRQRKKKHTEELEEEKKAFTERLASLEEELHNMRLEADHWHRQHLESQRVIDMLHWEKEDLVRTHTNETGELRRKVSILSDKVGSTAMSAAASSTGFSDLASDYDGLKLGAQGWDGSIFASEFGNIDAAAAAGTAVPVDTGVFSSEARVQQQQQQQQAPMARADNLSFATVKQDDPPQEKPAASGLLLMLLLCGAFVASKSASSSPPVIPRMSDEVRAASATVLDSIFRDAGVAPSASGGSVGTMTLANQRPRLAGHGMAMHAPAQMDVWSDFDINVASGGGGNGVGVSSLSQFQADLINPTSNQKAEQVFGMTVSQYNGITDTGFSYGSAALSSPDGGNADADADADGERNSDGQATPVTSPSGGSGGGFGSDGASVVLPSKGASQKRNLLETLAAMREQAPGRTAAEVYTRSLLWERIPADIVMEFKRMVEAGTGAAITAASANTNVQPSMAKT